MAASLSWGPFIWGKVGQWKGLDLSQPGGLTAGNLVEYLAIVERNMKMFEQQQTALEMNEGEGPGGQVWAEILPE